MLLGLELTAFIYLSICAVFWLLRPLGPGKAMLFFVAANVLVLYVVNVIVLMIAVLQFGLVAVLFALCRRLPRSRASQLAWLTFVSLVPVNLILRFPDLVDGLSMPAHLTELRFENVFWTVGVNFLVLKSFIVLKEALAANRFPWGSGLAALIFVPAFSAGPIHGSGPWKNDRLAATVPLRTWLTALLQIGWGAAALYVIAPYLVTLAERASASLSFGLVPEVYLRFAALYFDFSGYSLIAISFAAIFGATLPVNFNRPYLAVSITDFWRRWHMSLSGFIGTYLYKPFVRVTGSAQKGIFLAFLFAGLWHEMTLGYLLWGIGHGAALSLAMKPPPTWRAFSARLPPPARTALGWFLTMTWVASLSYLATEAFG